MNQKNNINHILWNLKKADKNKKKQMIHVEIYKEDNEKLKLLGIIKGNLSKSQLIREAITDYLIKNRILLNEIEKIIDERNGDRIK